MRAALQLLDHEEICDSNIFKNTSTSVRALGSSSSHGGSQGRNKNILKAGMLKKASGNKLSHVVWKQKYVEIQHGDFVYEDDIGGWGEHGKKKTIALIADKCRCRQLKAKNDSTLFEVTEYGGIRRIWRAASVEERDAWINAINAAMVGSAGDFEGGDAMVVFSPTPAQHSPRTTPKNSFTRLPRSSSKKRAQAEAALLVPYSEGIDIFTSTRQQVYNCSSTTDYRMLLSSFTRSHSPFVVPVGFSKVNCGVAFSS